MAHCCPECGQACYCGGDIDDIFFEDKAEAIYCTCCDGREDREETYDYDYDPDYELDDNGQWQVAK